METAIVVSLISTLRPASLGSTTGSEGTVTLPPMNKASSNTSSPRYSTLTG